MFSFMVSHSGFREGDDHDHGGDRRHVYLQRTASSESRAAVCEVDFFSDNKTRVLRRSDDDDDDDNDNDGGVDKQTCLKMEEFKEAHVNTGLNLGSYQSIVDVDVSSHMKEKRDKSELEQLQIELQRMNAENQRLKEVVAQVSNNYLSLQMHLGTLSKSRQNNDTDGESEEKISQEGDVPRRFIGLGPSANVETNGLSNSDERTRSGSLPVNNIGSDKSIGKLLGREESPEAESNSGWGPNKVQKLSNSAATNHIDQSAMRKARVSVRARSEAPMIGDGCQWRKYGQKLAKGNPCPRAYYRCTMAPGCPVRKQVQRCAADKSILITTYEGNHKHPLPPAAVAMASTTMAAVNMLLSGSTASPNGLMNPTNLLARSIFLPCSTSMATISASAPFPTITLDLTQSHTPNNNYISDNSTNPLSQFQQRQPEMTDLPLHPPIGQALYNQSKFSGQQFSNDQINQQDRNGPAGPAAVPKLVSADTVAAITADPNFTAAVAAAISSVISGSGHPTGNNNKNSSINSKR